MNFRTKKILILGVTASGKGRLAFELACELGGEIISIDSMKVYRRMDIGTAKPPVKYRQQINYHLIDVVEPSESYSVDKFLDMAHTAIKQITSRNKPIIAVGGTAMYIKTLLYGLFEGPGSNETIRAKLKTEFTENGGTGLHNRLASIDPQAAERIHPNDARRIIRALEVYEVTGKPISSFQKQFETEEMLDDWIIIGLRRAKEVENSRINTRVKRMVDMGLIDEVKSLLSEDKPLSKQAAFAIGYAEIIEHLNKGVNLDKATENIKINTRHLAKGQRTWFKTFKNVNWIELKEEQEILRDVLKLIK